MRRFISAPGHGKDARKITASLTRSPRPATSHGDLQELRKAISEHTSLATYKCAIRSLSLSNGVLTLADRSRGFSTSLRGKHGGGLWAVKAKRGYAWRFTIFR